MVQAPVVLYTAVTADGYIATKDGDVDFLDEFNKSATNDLGYKEFFDTVDTLIMGSKSYEQILAFPVPWPYAGKNSYVFTSRPLKTDRSDIFFVSGKPKDVLADIQAKGVSRIWVLGGAKLTASFVREELIDEFILTTIPIFLGDGIRLITPPAPRTKLSLIKSKSFPDIHVVQMHYKRKNSENIYKMPPNKTNTESASSKVKTQRKQEQGNESSDEDDEGYTVHDVVDILDAATTTTDAATEEATEATTTTEEAMTKNKKKVKKKVKKKIKKKVKKKATATTETTVTAVETTATATETIATTTATTITEPETATTETVTSKKKIVKKKKIVHKKKNKNKKNKKNDEGKILDEKKEEFLKLVAKGNKKDVNDFLLKNAADAEKNKSDWVGEPVPIKKEKSNLTPEEEKEKVKRKEERMCQSYLLTIKELKKDLAKGHLIVWKVEQDLMAEGINDMVMDAKEQVGRLYDEGLLNNKHYDPEDEDESKELAGQALALLTEKLYYEREISIKQKAYIFLTIINGKQKFRLGDLAFSFKGHDFEEEGMTRWIYKWVNHYPNTKDKHCSFRIWESHPNCEKIVTKHYGYA